MALGDLVGISTNQGVRAYDNGDGTFSLQVQTVAGTPTTTVITKYVVVNAFAVPAPGGAVNDIVQSIQSYNTITGALLSTVWTNLTQGTVLASAPAAADIALQATNDPFGTQTFFYVAKLASGSISVGDVVANSINTDLLTGATVETWYNVTTGLLLTGGNIPPYGNLDAVTPIVSAQLPAALGPQTQANSLSVVVANPATGDVSYSTNFLTTTAFLGAALGDILSRVVILNPGAVPPTIVSTTWYNLTQQTTLPAGPATVTWVEPITGGGDLDATALFFAVVASAGNYAVDDVIQQVKVLNPSTVPPSVVSTSYNNLTQNIPNITIAAQTDIVPVGTPGGAVANNVSTTAFFAANVTNVPAGYNLGDSIQKIEIINSITAAVVSTTWVNITQGTTLAPPTLTELTASQTQLPPALGPQVAAESLSVYVTNQSTTTSFPVTSQYLVSTAFAVPAPGGAVGDLIQELQIYDTSTSPATITTTVWSNLTTNLVYPSAVSFADLTSVTSSALTNAELRASPVPTVNTVLPVTAAVSIEVGVGTTIGTEVQVSFANQGTATALVAGTPIPAGSSLDFTAPTGGTINPIAYDATGTSLLVATLI